MLLRLMLLMTIVPAVELVLLFKVHELLAASFGSGIGLLATIGLIIATGVIGANLARHQGLKIFNQMQTDMAQGKIPADPTIDGVLILIGGALLLTPGILTDVFGFSLLLPLTRSFYRARMQKWVEKKLQSGQMHFHQSSQGPQGFHFHSTTFQGRAHQDPHVVDAEYKSISD